MIDYESIKKKFATNFRCLVSERDCTQMELANLLDTSQVTISKLMNAKAFPTSEKLIAIADLFGVTVSELLGETAPSREEAPRYEFRKPAIDKRELESMEYLHDRGIIEDEKYYGYITEKLKEIAE